MTSENQGLLKTDMCLTSDDLRGIADSLDELKKLPKPILITSMIVGSFKVTVDQDLEGSGQYYINQIDFDNG